MLADVVLSPQAPFGPSAVGSTTARHNDGHTAPNEGAFGLDRNAAGVWAAKWKREGACDAMRGHELALGPDQKQVAEPSHGCH
jgi:hypothetical protein